MTGHSKPDLKRFQRRLKIAVSACYAGLACFPVLALGLILSVQSGNDFPSGPQSLGIITGYLAFVWFPICLFHYFASKCPFCGKSVNIGREWPVAKTTCPHCTANLTGREMD